MKFRGFGVVLLIVTLGCGSSHFRAHGGRPGDKQSQEEGIPMCPGSSSGRSGVCQDVFTQSARAEVDIVLAVDDSPSMESLRDALAVNAARFTDRLLDARVDFRMIVVPVQPSRVSEEQGLRSLCRSLEDLGDDGILTPETAHLIENCILSVGHGGDGFEEGLEAVVRALNPDFSLGPQNPGFIRPNAPLELIFLTDEEDQPRIAPRAPGSWHGAGDVTDEMLNALGAQMTDYLVDSGRPRDGYESVFPLVDSHLDLLAGFKGGDMDNVRVHSIVYLEEESGGDACWDVPGRTAEPGMRYKLASDLTGGSVTDLCTVDWSKAMDHLGLEVSGLRSCFNLTFNPGSREEILAVTVGGYLADDEEWIYEVPHNRVCFEPEAPPETKVRVFYRVPQEEGQ